ncbi:hypothetical protein COK25_15265 [Bacillus cereus]|uniref:Uncharacterized protein n=1 Tax=Bacillus cereus TaxID=1396 RepID=A0A9X7QKU5_BACCE|nr:hypothetical protein BUM91_09550 [Bacillus thuringiensis]OTX89403.1 hypothetical protein BK726_12905 [Bacillus thuringiensis serovar londrina]PEA97977.1 hypothetical protein CON66_00355 [Bacillus cereus]PKS18467.1 hypothetical protein CX118_06225 [Bacillus sp. BI3]PED33213.1 hypothetical protein CON13_04300 [Bacillus cereus]
MIFYKKINVSVNVWAFNMTYFFIIFILKRKGIICIFIQTSSILTFFNTFLKTQKASNFDAFQIS